MQRMAHLFSIPDVAEHLRIPVADLQRFIDAGMLRTVPASSEVTIHQADLEAFIASRLVPPMQDTDNTDAEGRAA